MPHTGTLKAAASPPKSAPADAKPQPRPVRELVRHLPERKARLLDRFIASPILPMQGDLWFAWQEVGERPELARLVCSGPCGVFMLAVDRLASVSPTWQDLPEHLPDDVVLGLTESAAAPVLSVLSAIFGDGIHVNAIKRPRTEGSAGPFDETSKDVLTLGFVLGRATGERVARGWLTGSVHTLERAALARPGSVWLPHALALPVTLRLYAGQATLTVRQLMTLRSGDVLRLDQAPGRHGDLHVSLEAHASFRFEGRLKDRQLSLETFMNTASAPGQPAQPVRFAVSEQAAPGTPGGGAPSAQSPAAQDGGSGGLTAVGGLPCVVRAELAELRLTVSQVAELRPGRSLPLGTRLDERAVSLTINDRCVAKGELVMLGSELAVMITQAPVEG